MRRAQNLARTGTLEQIKKLNGALAARAAGKASVDRVSFLSKYYR